MKSFSIDDEQLARLVCALTGDELARHFNHYTDFVAQAEWGPDTPVGEDGAELTQEQLEACARRFCSFFDKPADSLITAASDTFGSWSQQVKQLIEKDLRTFRFHPATQGGVAEARHSADEVWQDARMIASLMHGRRRIITMVSTHSLFGFVTSVLAPNLQHLSVVDGRAMSPDLLADSLTFGDILIATPTLWRYLAQTLPSFPNNVMGLSFGEPLMLDLSAELREMGLGAMRELYGSTETGIIGWRDTPSEPFVLFDHWAADGEKLVRTCPDGQVRELTAMDHLLWEGDRTFSLAGRRDGAVQIGAVNVFPQKIGEIIAEHPDIAGCNVRVAQRSGALDRLIAHIDLNAGVSPNQDMAWRVDEWCRKKLRPPERPRIYVFGQVS
ncbi:hypothetical protein [Parvularcula sp. IMCC14364]|uniref:hypothetical protein n=1 Tax=Parvularcula sp. IMCC14364 TaxID=3067902 RepID=UPI0027418EFB|nr:hypothetical protein [Parvularcula sp. IMCC14364]